MSIETGPFSRFRFTDPVIFNGKDTFPLPTKPSFLDKSTLRENEIIRRTVTSKTQGRPDLIANDVYGTSFLFWVPILFNKPEEPIGWPPTGLVIELPIPRKVLAEL